MVMKALSNTKNVDFLQEHSSQFFGNTKENKYISIPIFFLILTLVNSAVILLLYLIEQSSF